MLTRFLSPILTAILPAAVRNAVLRPIAQIDHHFFNNPRALRVFLMWCIPGLFLMVLSLFVPGAIAYCPGALWLVPIGLGLAWVASRSQNPR